MKRVYGLSAMVLLVGSFVAAQQPPVPPPPKAQACWNVEDVKAGMKGHGKTVMKGTKIESFGAEVIGVLKNVNPGRDLILCRLSGLNLDNTGVIAGMSGSPVYIDGKLLGAVAYGWAFGKEPIAGITPYIQMHSFAAAHERREVAEKKKPPTRIGLASPLILGGKPYHSATVANDFREPEPAAADGLWLMPLRTPVMTTGMTPRSLAVLRDSFAQTGLIPMQGGGVAGNIPESERNIPMTAGGALTVALITGDFDMSGIGTVTHVDGKRVYGWGHPFMGVGSCDLPLMTGYVHTVFASQQRSFKIGSPLRTVGVVNTDVSTCIAGWLDRQPDLLPVASTILREPEGRSHTYNVKVVRLRSLLGPLVMTALVNSVDMEGNFPDEMSAHLKLRIDIEGRDPLLLDDWFAGPNFTGDRAAQSLYMPVGMLLQQLSSNAFAPLRFKAVECTTEVLAGRRTADIEATELESDTVAPGETLKAQVTLRPFRGPKQRITLEVKIPVDLPDGNYTALIGDDLNNARMDLRDNPQLGTPQTIEDLFGALQLQLSAKRTNLVMRVPISSSGVAISGKALPNLPPSMVQILSSSRKSNPQTIYNALVARAATNWVVQGADTLRFQVAKNKRVSR